MNDRLRCVLNEMPHIPVSVFLNNRHFCFVALCHIFQNKLFLGITWYMLLEKMIKS